MQVSNAVIGGKVQIKRDCRGHSREFIKGGLICTISQIDDGYITDYELRLVNPSIEEGYAWVNASDCRKYNGVTEEAPTEPTPEPVGESEEAPVLSCADVQVGDWLVATDVDTNLVAGVAYPVVGFSTITGRVGVAVHTSTERAWQSVYYLNREDYSTVLREVTPRG